MKQRARLIIAAGALVVIGCQDATRPDVEQPDFASAAGLANRYVVVFTGDVPDAPGLAGQLVGTHGGSLHHTYQYALRGFAATLSPGAVDALRRNPRVAFVEPDLEVTATVQVLPTGIDRIDADQNATAKIDGIDERVDVDIAILDTGSDPNHPDLNVFAFQNCIDLNDNDGAGHGSHVAGTAAALDNGIGVVGVAPGARIWAVKVLGDNGSGTIGSLICGLDFVTANAAAIEVGNMSLSAQGTSNALHTAIANSVSAGVFYAVSAGNNGIDVFGRDETHNTGDDIIPAAYREVATVSAMADFDGQAGGLEGRRVLIGCGRVFDDAIADCFSNFSTNVAANNPVNSPGAAIDVAAPGVSVFSTYKNGGTATLTGTSMSAPHVAGAAALFIAINGRATNAAGVAAIRQALIDAGQPQSQWNPDKTRDDDDNLEPLIFVGGFGPPPAPDTDGPVTSGVAASPNPTDGAASVTLSANVDDAATGSSNIAAAESFVDAVGLDGAGTPMSASDGAFDSPTEAVTANVSTAGLTLGLHTLHVHGQDANGNWGATSSVVLDVTASPPDTGGPVVIDCNPASSNQDARPMVTITGSNFQAGATVDFGQEVEVRDVVFISATQLEVEIRIDKRAPLGPRDVIVTNPDVQSGTGVDCFTVNPEN